MTRRPVRALVVAVVAVVAAAGVTTVVKASNGAFSGQYVLAGMFTKAGEGLHPGSAVNYRGVQVGRVASIDLVDRAARVQMLINRSFHVPSDATATIRPLNVFGADQVTLDFPQGDSAGRLAAGGVIAHTTVSSELGDLFAAADPLLAKIDAPDLSSVVSDLAQASVNEGPTIAASIDEGARLADLLDRTLPNQLRALDSFSSFTTALTPTASSFNAISNASNQALPAFNRAAPSYQRLLQTLAPFADDLAQFLSAYHPDIETLLNAGDNVARVVLVHQQDIGNVIQGLGVYFQRFAQALNPNEVLADGSQFGYFQTFILFSDLNQLVCSLIAPASPGLAFLQPLQQALTGAGTPFNCASQIAAFNAAQNHGALSPGSALAASQQAAQQLQTHAYQSLTAPQVPTPTGIGGIVNSILGAGGGLVSGTGGALGGGAGSSASGSSGSPGGGGLLGGPLP